MRAGRFSGRRPMATRGASRQRRTYSAAVARVWLDHGTAHGFDREPRPFPSRLTPLAIGVHMACRELGAVVRARWAAEGQEQLDALLAAHPELSELAAETGARVAP